MADSMQRLVQSLEQTRLRNGFNLTRPRDLLTCSEGELDSWFDLIKAKREEYAIGLVE